MLSLASGVVHSLLLTWCREQEEASGSKGKEEEEIHIYQHDRVASPASKQGAGQQHSQKCNDVASSVHSEICFSFSLLN